MALRSCPGRAALSGPEMVPVCPAVLTEGAPLSHCHSHCILGNEAFFRFSSPVLSAFTFSYCIYTHFLSFKYMFLFFCGENPGLLCLFGRLHNLAKNWDLYMNMTIKEVSGLVRGPCMDLPSLLWPQLRPTSCGERVAFCCILVGMGMCGRVGKQAVVWLVNSQGEGPFILVWCLRFTVILSLPLSVPQRSVFA